MDDYGSSFIRYSSFIFLGLSLSIGYFILRWMSAKKEKLRSAEDALREEIERLRQERAARGETDSASGLEGPNYTPEERAAIERARAIAQETESR